MVINRLVVGAVTAALFCGCGTMANLDGRRLAMISMPDEERPRVFGGVQNDFGWLTTVRDPVVITPINLMFAVDLPISLVADIVTLPEVRRGQIRWDAEKSADAHPVKPPAPIPDAASESK